MRSSSFLKINTLWLSALLSGGLVALSSAPFDMWYLAYVAFVPLFVSCGSRQPKIQGLAFALCCSVIAVNWWHSTIIYSFLFFVLIVVILCFAFFLWGSLSASLKISVKHPAINVFAPALIWVGLERILSSELVGIPCNIGISQAQQPVLIQAAEFFGIYTISFILVLSNTVIARLFMAQRSRLTVCPREWGVMLLAIVLLISNVIYGFYKSQDTTQKGPLISVSVIQPVIESEQYLNGWRSPETRTFIKEVVAELTDQALSEKPDILAWPEGGNGYLNMRITDLRDSIYRKARQNETDFLISSNDIDSEGRKYNSVFSISRDGRLLGRYDKVQLVPGAEDSYTPGKNFSPVASSYGPVGPVICYESNFPSPLRKSTANGAQLLFVSTSDAAFRKTSLTINHTRTAVFRAIENNRWVVHASNTGPSVIVSPRGRIAAESSMYKRGYISAGVEFIVSKTVFTRFGYLLPVILAIGTICYALYYLYSQKLASRSLHAVWARLDYFASIDQREVEAAVKSFLKSSIRIILLLIPPYVLFLVIIVLGSISIVFNQVSPGESLSNAIDEFMAPRDPLADDHITERFLQASSNTCGPAVVAYVLSFYGKELTEDDLVSEMVLNDKGSSMLELKRVVQKNGFQAIGVRESYGALLEEPLPVIAYINDSHYVVINNVTSNSVFMFDPTIGHIIVPKEVFTSAWNGYLLLIRVKDIQKTMLTNT